MTSALEKLLNRERGAEPALMVFATGGHIQKYMEDRSLVKQWGSKHRQSTTRLVRQRGRRNCVYALVARDTVPLLATAFTERRTWLVECHKWISALSAEARFETGQGRMLASHSAKANAGTAARRRSLGGFGAFAPELSCLARLGRSGARFGDLSVPSGRCTRGSSNCQTFIPSRRSGAKNGRVRLA